MNKIIKLENVHKELIWGTEDWVVSGHENGMSKVIGGEFNDLEVSELINLRPDIFNHQVLDKLPLLIKIIDAKDDLSIQVHPNDSYASEHENSLGKTECWYILDADEDADIIVGHHAKDKNELQRNINDLNVLKSLDVLDVNKGDFFYIPAGTIHAIRKNTKILEVQQSSDITYRLYDYQRISDNTLRELHINKALDVITFGENTQNNQRENISVNDAEIELLCKSDFFDVYKLVVNGKNKITNEFDYLLGTSLSDDLTINGEKLSYGQGFIIPHLNDVEVSGNGEFVLTTIVRR